MHEDSASLKLTIDQQICPQFNMLNIDDLQEVLNKVFPARHKWYIMDIQLGMKADDLDAIKRDNHNVSDCLMEMLKIWLRQGGTTRLALTAALQSECVHYPDIATFLLMLRKLKDSNANSVGKVHYKSI